MRAPASVALLLCSALGACMERNGVLVHDDVEVESPTGGGQPEQARAPVRLQDHGNPVRFRNIWILPR